MTDLISRQAAIDVVNAICDRCGKYKEYNGVMCGACALDGVEDSIEDLPSAEPVRHGKWIDIDEQTYTWKIRCSCCGYERSMLSTQGKYPNYCEACGARMDEE